MAINASETPETATAANNSGNANGSSENKNEYAGKDESKLKYPRMLLERILANKRKNAELEIEATQLKKIYHKLKQQVRLQDATVSNETIEIS